MEVRDFDAQGVIGLWCSFYLGRNTLVCHTRLILLGACSIGFVVYTTCGGVFRTQTLVYTRGVLWDMSVFSMYFVAF